jgi:hypothetical protein
MESNKNESASLQFFWGKETITLEVRLILIAAVGGALGAYVHLATSFADYAGNEKLTRNWCWWYLFRPLVGMALAEVVYFAMRGGLLPSTNTATSAISPYGVCAITALSGLFSRQATDKLKEVFETIFRVQQPIERKDPLTPPDPSSDVAAETAEVGVKTAKVGASRTIMVLSLIG